MPELILAFTLVFWIAAAVVSFRYLQHLFSDLRFAWSPSNRALMALICVAGPAAIICGLVVDAARPIV